MAVLKDEKVVEPDDKKTKKDAAGNKKDKKVEELSEDDKKLKEDIELLMERLNESNQSLYKPALESIRSTIRSSTTSMTSVPKPLKFLRPHFDSLKTIHEKIKDPQTKAFCADVVSVLAMTYSGSNECLKYRILGSKEEIGSWGHEYVRHLGAEARSEWDKPESEHTHELLLSLVFDIVPYHMSHNAEAEACDLLMEIERLDLVKDYVDKSTYQRVCLYLTSCVPYVPDPENVALMRCALEIYRKYDRYADALRVAMQLNDLSEIKSIFYSCGDDKLLRKQLAFMMARQQILFEPDESEGATSGGETDWSELADILSNGHLNGNFLSLARELDIVEPKTPEHVYKSHLEPSRFGSLQVDSAKQNLAAAFVNGFLNCGFGKDNHLMVDGQDWIFKNKNEGIMCATASLGLIMLWDIDGGLTEVDRYLYSDDNWVKAGALLATGVLHTGVRNDCDPAKALLCDFLLHKVNSLRIGSTLGLGLAYAGSNREEIISLITPVLSDTSSTVEAIGFAALSLGLICVASGNGDVTSVLLQTLMEQPEPHVKDTYSRYIALGLALIYLGKQEDSEVIMASLAVLSEPMKSMACLLLDICAYAGTGNVLKIQHLLHICSEHYEDPAAGDKKDGKKDKDDKDKKDKDKDKGDNKNKSKDAETGGGGGAEAGTSGTSAAGASSKKKDGEAGKMEVDGEAEGEPTSEAAAASTEEDGADTDAAANKMFAAHQGLAVLGIALIAMGEDIGCEMAFRGFGHLMRYGEPVIRRAVPLALALTSVSNPKLTILDTLSKLSHDTDSDVAVNAIFSMGIVGAGTNNARLASMLRQLAVYYTRDPNTLFMVRIAQGLAHIGKGTMSLSPHHSDRALMSPVAVGGLMAALVSCLDVKHLILGKSSYVLFCLTAAIQPRMFQTFDENLKPLSVTVRVGQAVDVVGQAGRPKTITGFQTHTTPVVLQHGERVELASEEYIPLSPILEGFVILRKNKDYVE